MAFERKGKRKKQESHVIPLLLPMDLMKWFHEERIARQKKRTKKRNNSKSHVCVNVNAVTPKTWKETKHEISVWCQMEMLLVLHFNNCLFSNYHVHAEHRSNPCFIFKRVTWKWQGHWLQERGVARGDGGNDTYFIMLQKCTLNIP